MKAKKILTIEQKDLDVCRHPIIVLMLSQAATLMHGHGFAEIAVILEGECFHRTLREKSKLQRGDVLLIPYGAVHAYEDTQELQLINVLFNPKHFILLREIHELSCVGALFANEGSGTVKNIGVQKLHFDEKEIETVKSILDRMLKECADQKTAGKCCLLGLFLIFLSQVARFSHSNNKADKLVPENISKVVSYMRKNHAEDICLKDLVKYSNMSLSSFMRSFTECMGTAPMNYLSEIRLSNSCAMLQNTELSISEIAMKSGYNDSNYFSRLFRKRLGVTPRKFRFLCNK